MGLKVVADYFEDREEEISEGYHKEVVCCFAKGADRGEDLEEP